MLRTLELAFSPGVEYAGYVLRVCVLKKKSLAKARSWPHLGANVPDYSPTPVVVLSESSQEATPGWLAINVNVKNSDPSYSKFETSVGVLPSTFFWSFGPVGQLSRVQMSSAKRCLCSACVLW
ncbi:hypothetical protein AVEN_165791-1 [Araneus ventricosus]|uniref:Uncharacterized protein n=1 Tax=Araneus ventricosus TaxID=182803 RepID=A0A4Y2JWF9_ARAVE|nr:hypothetical protein AVEN_165791-1 [Araneus ventricosus]